MDDLLPLVYDELKRIAARELRGEREGHTCRFYGGMSIEENAEALEVSAATIKREWALARAWLNRELAA